MLLLSAGVTLLEGNAVAATCDDSTHVWVEAQPENGVYRRGIEVRDPGLYTGGPQFTDCFRVASNILWKSGSDNIEIGWIIDTPAISICWIPTGYGIPFLFRYWRVAGGAKHCSYYTSPVPDPGSYYEYRVVRDGSDLHIFHTYFNDSEVGASIDTGSSGMTTGIPITNAERYQNYDTAYGNWDGLRYKDSSGWHAWTNTVRDYLDCDSYYDDYFEIGGSWDHVEVNPGSNGGC